MRAHRLRLACSLAWMAWKATWTANDTARSAWDRPDHAAALAAWVTARRVDPLLVAIANDFSLNRVHEFERDVDVLARSWLVNGPRPVIADFDARLADLLASASDREYWIAWRVASEALQIGITMQRAAAIERLDQIADVARLGQLTDAEFSLLERCTNTAH